MKTPEKRLEEFKTKEELLDFLESIDIKTSILSDISKDLSSLIKNTLSTKDNIEKIENKIIDERNDKIDSIIS
jgi:hypothetical protein